MGQLEVVKERLTIFKVKTEILLKEVVTSIVHLSVAVPEWFVAFIGLFKELNSVEDWLEVVKEVFRDWVSDSKDKL